VTYDVTQDPYGAFILRAEAELRSAQDKQSVFDRLIAEMEQLDEGLEGRELARARGRVRMHLTDMLRNP
jgi:hypothetical protein